MHLALYHIFKIPKIISKQVSDMHEWNDRMKTVREEAFYNSYIANFNYFKYSTPLFQKCKYKNRPIVKKSNLRPSNAGPT